MIDSAFKTTCQIAKNHFDSLRMKGEKHSLNPFNIALTNNQTFRERFNAAASIWLGEHVHCSDRFPTLNFGPIDKGRPLVLSLALSLLEIKNTDRYGILDYAIGLPVHLVSNLIPFIPIVVAFLGIGAIKLSVELLCNTLNIAANSASLGAFILVPIMAAILFATGCLAYGAGILAFAISKGISYLIDSFIQKIVLPATNLILSPISALIASGIQLHFALKKPSLVKAAKNDAPNHVSTKTCLDTLSAPKAKSSENKTATNTPQASALKQHSLYQDSCKTNDHDHKNDVFYDCMDSSADMPSAKQAI